MTSDKVAEALGATRVVKLPRTPRDPLDALTLMRKLHERLQPGRGLKRGRPGNPDWTLRRLVPFSEEAWGRLNEYAAAFSTNERRVSPAQVAAAMLEELLIHEDAAANDLIVGDDPPPAGEAAGLFPTPEEGGER
jgi:hypothetical protein